MTEGTGEKGLVPFNMSQVQWQPKNDAGMCDSGIGSMRGEEGSRRTPKSIGMIMNKIDDSEFKMCKMSATDYMEFTGISGYYQFEFDTA